MFKNNLKVALRYLSKHKGYTVINISGLAVGIACCILIMLFVRSEWSYDRFHTKTGRIYRAWMQEHYQGQVFENTTTPVPLGPVLQAGLPEIERSCRIANLNLMVKRDKNAFNEDVAIADSTFFSVFNFELKDNIKNPFPVSNAIVLTESTAKKYFGKTNAIGQNLQVDFGNEKVLFTVSAIAKDPPLESTIKFNMLIPFSNAHYLWSEKTRTSAWSVVLVKTFLLLKDGIDPGPVNKKIASIMNPLVAENYKPGEYIVQLQPLKDIHFNSSLPASLPGDSNPKYSYILGTIGILILLIACINFVTLSIGRSTTRAMEVGMRKVLGAERNQLVRQFWGEGLLLTLLSLGAGLLLAIVLLKPFNQLANRELSLYPDVYTVLYCLLIVALIAFIAGIYPAIILSGFKPIQVLKGRLKVSNNMGFFRKALIVGQFVASIVMIIATISVGKQLTFLKTKDLGYNRDHVIIVPTNMQRSKGNQVANRFKNILATNPQVVSTTASLYSMGEYGWMTLGYTDNQDVFRQFAFNAVDVDFIKTMGLHIITGRSFDKNNAADSNSILVNEALVKEYGWKDPIGQKLPGKYEQRVIGVVKDFHFESLHSGIRPTVLALKPDSIFRSSSDFNFELPPDPRVSVRFKAGDVTAQLAFLRKSWKTAAGDQDFEFKFLDDALATAYQQEQRLGNIVRYASFLSIFIACMGLFGLATLIVVRRTKEIGIRKVLGADISSIVVLLSKDFIVLVVIASLIAFPVAWWALSKWLQDFAYRINIPVWLFGLSALLALVVALVTVSFQAIKAAIANPVKSLRTE